MKTLVILIIQFVFTQQFLFSQPVHWAYKVDKFSSEYSRDRHGAKEILGLPNVDHKGRSSVYAWRVKPNLINKESVEIAYIEVSYKNTVNAQQLAVFQNFNPGCISEIFIAEDTTFHSVFVDEEVLKRSCYLPFDKQGLQKFQALKGKTKRKIFKKNKNFKSKGGYEIQRVWFTPQKVKRIRIVINPYAIDKWNEIDAIGVSESTDSIQFPIINEVKTRIFSEEKKRNAGVSVNTKFAELNPVFEPYKQTLYYTRTDHRKNFYRKNFYRSTQDIWYSQLITQECPSCELQNGRKQFNQYFATGKHWNKKFNNVIPNTVACFTNNGSKMYLNNLYPDKNCNCDSLFLNYTDGISTIISDSTYWTKINNIESYNIEKEIIKYYENFHINGEEDLIVASEKNKNISFHDIYVFSKKDTSWNAPELIGNSINTLTYYGDSTQLSFFIDTIQTDNNIDVRIGTKTWGQHKRQFIENFANVGNYFSYWITNNDSVLILSTDNKNSFGDRDLFVSFRKNDSTFTEPISLGDSINTLSDESNPFYDEKYGYLYFASAGHAGYGDRDIYRVRRLDKNWKVWRKPENLGPIVNSPTSDAFYKISQQTRTACFASNYKPLRKKGLIYRKEYSDIYLIQTYEDIKKNKDNTQLSFNDFQTRVDTVYLTNKVETVYLRDTIYTPAKIEYIKKDSLTVIVMEKPVYKEKLVYVDKIVEKNVVIYKDTCGYSGGRIELPSECDTTQIPAYIKYHDYNIATIPDEQQFNTLVNTVIENLKDDKLIDIYIESSASKVPTYSFPNNKQLAVFRATRAQTTIQEKLITEIEKNPHWRKNIKYINNSKVAGPDYKKDKERKEIYGPYQYVKIWLCIKSK